jgi:hypothetical protein
MGPWPDWGRWATGSGTVTSQSPPQWFNAGLFIAGDAPEAGGRNFPRHSNHPPVAKPRKRLSLHFQGAIRTGIRHRTAKRRTLVCNLRIASDIPGMNVLLNSRILVGEKHDAAADFARRWSTGTAPQIEWLLSPSELCVLDITTSPGEAMPPASSFGNSSRPTLAMVNRLEDDLRRHLGMRLSPDQPLYR